MTVSRGDVLRYRFRRHELHRAPGSAPGPADVALLDYGVQDTGTDGAAWALAVRGAPAAGADELAFAWTMRGAPHAYRRSALGAVAVATAPWSEADAAKRIFDAAKPLKADVWRTLGRPGGIVADGEIIGTWRPRASGQKLHVRIEPWRALRARDRGLVEEQAERLAAHRGVTLAGIVEK